MKKMDEYEEMMKTVRLYFKMRYQNLDPEVKARLLSNSNEKIKARYHSDPEFRERVKANGKKHYHNVVKPRNAAAKATSSNWTIYQ